MSYRKPKLEETVSAGNRTGKISIKKIKAHGAYEHVEKHTEENSK